MIYKNKYLLLPLLFFTALSFAADTPLQVRMLQRPAQPAAGWVMFRSAVPIVRDSVQFKNPLSVAHPELLSMDAYRQTLLIPQIGKGKIEYRLTASSGAPLGGFTLLRDNDLPVPAAEVDAQDRRIYFLEVDGRISVYDYQGTRVWEIPPPQDYSFTYENTYFSHWNAKRHILVTVYSAPLKSSKRRFDTLIREYDASGRPLSRRVLPGVQTLKSVCDSEGQTKLLLARSQSSDSGVSVLLLDSRDRVVWRTNRI